MLRILGIDPGLHITGWGAVDYDGYHLKYVAHGVIKTDPAVEVEHRLGDIYRGLSEVIEKIAPQEVSVEQVFVNSNPVSSLKLGMARGVALCVADIMGLKTFGYTPNAIKKTVVGSGHATKEQTSSMVKKLLNCGEVKHDAADALSVAICHAHNSRFLRLVI